MVIWRRDRASSAAVHRVGAIAKRANRTGWRAIANYSTITIATLVGVSVTLLVEIWGEWSELATRSSIAIGLALLLFGFRSIAVRRLRKIAMHIGSFFYVSSLRPTQTDRDEARFDRAMSHLQHMRALDAVARDALIFEKVSQRLEDSSVARVVHQLYTAFDYAARNDRADLPTNLVINAAWPISVGFGYLASERLLNTGVTGGARLWHLPVASEITKIPVDAERDGADTLTVTQLMAGELIDIVTLTPVDFPALEEVSHVGDAALAIHATKSPVNFTQVEQTLDELKGELDNPAIFTRQVGVGGTNKYEPLAEFEHIAIEIATQIAAFRQGVSGSLYISLRAAKEQALIVGVLLAYWKVDLSRCLFLAPPESSGERTLEIWDLKLSPPTAGEESNSASVAPSDVGEPIVATDAVQLLNFTPHDVNVLAADGTVDCSVPASGRVCRVGEHVVAVQHIDAAGSEHAVSLRSIRYLAAEGLPAPTPGVLIIVSRVTAAACPDRSDLIFPLDEVREGGTIIGCRGFGRFAEG